MAAQESDLEDQHNGLKQDIPSVKVSGSQQTPKVSDSQKEAVQVAATQPPAFVKVSQPDRVQDEPVDEDGASTELSNAEANEDLPPFDWKDFETRYELAMAAARDKEAGLLQEFNNQVKVELPHSHRIRD